MDDIMAKKRKQRIDPYQAKRNDWKEAITTYCRSYKTSDDLFQLFLAYGRAIRFGEGLGWDEVKEILDKEYSLIRTKYVKSDEDWYPTVNGEVKVSLYALTTNQWRVCVWGGDDFGLEKDFPPEQRKAAEDLYDKIHDNMSQDAMYAEGMVAA